MKKLIYFFALLGIVSMASCSGKSNNASTTEVVMVTDSLVPDTATIAVYEGILPGADVAGIQYVLELGQTANGDSVYQLSMTYLGANKGKDTTFIQEGQWGIIKNGKISPKSSSIFQLNESAGVVFNFLDMNDSIIMLGQDMKLPQSKLNYSLKKK